MHALDLQDSPHDVLLQLSGERHDDGQREAVGGRTLCGEVLLEPHREARRPSLSFSSFTFHHTTPRAGEYLSPRAWVVIDVIYYTL